MGGKIYGARRPITADCYNFMNVIPINVVPVGSTALLAHELVSDAGDLDFAFDHTQFDAMLAWANDKYDETYVNQNIISLPYFDVQVDLIAVHSMEWAQFAMNPGPEDFYKPMFRNELLFHAASMVGRRYPLLHGDTFTCANTKYSRLFFTLDKGLTRRELTDIGKKGKPIKNHIKLTDHEIITLNPAMFMSIIFGGVITAPWTFETVLQACGEVFDTDAYADLLMKCVEGFVRKKVEPPYQILAELHAIKPGVPY